MKIVVVLLITILAGLGGSLLFGLLMRPSTASQPPAAIAPAQPGPGGTPRTGPVVTGISQDEDEDQPAPPSFEPSSLNFHLQLLAGGLTEPTGIVNADDSTNRLFVAERAGKIRVIRGGRLQPNPLLDLTAQVGTRDAEQGLLSVAFHPDFSSNGFLYVCYTDRNGAITIARFTVAPTTSDTADPRSGKVILQIPHTQAANHNGGQIAFGPDGYLYIG